MDHFNAVKAITATTGTGNMTVSGTAARSQSFSTIPVGSYVPLRIEDLAGTDWEVSMCTILSASTFSRDVVLAGSAYPSKTNFAAGSKSILQTVVAEQLNAMLSVTDISFSTSVPLTRPGISHMPQQTVSGPLTFTPAAGAVRGALVYLRLVANGVNAPNLSAFKQWGLSGDYLNTAGITSQLQFFYDGYDYFYSVSQAVGATAVDSIPPTVSSASVANGTPAVIVFTVSEALDPNYAPATSSVTVGGHTVTGITVSGSTFSVTVSAAFVSGEAARQASYTQPGAGGLRDLAGNLMASFSGRAVTNNVGASATAPAQMAAPVATVGESSAGITLVAPNDGGNPITGYTVVSTPAGGVDAAAGTTALTRTITGLTPGTAYTFKSTATNGVGVSVASPSSNSVVPTAASVTFPQYPRVAVTGETGNGPFSYPAGSSAAGKTQLITKTLAGDGYWIFRQEAYAQMWIGMDEAPGGSYPSGNTYDPGGNAKYAVGSSSGSWKPASAHVELVPLNNVSISNNGVPAQGDWVRWKRVGTTLTIDISKNQGSTWTLIYSWAGVSVPLYAELACANTFTLIGAEGLT